MDMPSSVLSPRDINEIQTIAIQAGMPMYEVEKLIEWEVTPLAREEKAVLSDMVTLLVNRYIDKTHFHQNCERVYDSYTAFLGTHISRVTPNWFKSIPALKRVYWQKREMTSFIDWCFWVAPLYLAAAPVKLPSGKYDETLKVERSQQDLINETAMELVSLPPFHAYAKIIDQASGIQQVFKHKIQTLPLPEVLRGAEIEASLIEKSHVLCQDRELIEEDIRQRQEKWRTRPGNEPEKPPEEPPPPTRF